MNTASIVAGRFPDMHFAHQVVIEGPMQYCQKIVYVQKSVPHLTCPYNYMSPLAEKHL